jgi:hypothetical protein
MAGFDGFCQRPKKFYNRQKSNSAMDSAIDGMAISGCD